MKNIVDDGSFTTATTTGGERERGRKHIS